MTIAKTLEKYLAEQGVDYTVLSHSPTPSASRTAQASHISGHHVAKGVLLKDGDKYLLALLPASHAIHFEELGRVLGRGVSLASEEEIQSIFPDCETGAIPAIGSAYGLDVIMDETLKDQSEVYIEGGDHTSLVHVAGDQFQRLLGDVRHAHFSAPA